MNGASWSAQREADPGPQPDIRLWIRHAYNADVNRIRELQRERVAAARAPQTRGRPQRRQHVEFELQRIQQIAKRRADVAAVNYRNETDPLPGDIVELVDSGRLPEYLDREVDRQVTAQSVGKAIRAGGAVRSLQRAARYQRSKAYGGVRRYREGYSKSVGRVLRRRNYPQELADYRLDGGFVTRVNGALHNGTLGENIEWWDMQED